MTGWLALGLWALLAAASGLVWRRSQATIGRPWLLAAILAGLVAGTAAVAILAVSGRPLPLPGTWLALAVAAAATVLSGGVVAICVLGLADATARQPAARVQPDVLRGGSWIGALERLALLGTLLAGWPDGLVAIVAVKAFARYPELKTGQSYGAIERFIIGSFASLGWAAACAGVATLLL